MHQGLSTQIVGLPLRQNQLLTKSRSLIGYARVSSFDQSVANQVKQLKAAGCSVVRQEKASGKSRDGRGELATILDFVCAGDTLVVVKLVCLGRSNRDVLNLVHELAQKEAHLKVLEPEITTKGLIGKMVLTVLGMVAEMALGFIRDRQRAGIEAAKARGVYKGRAPLNHKRIAALRAAGKAATVPQRPCIRFLCLAILCKGAL